MKTFFSVLTCGLLLITGSSANTLVTKVTPVQKVLEMLGAMKVKSEQMKQTEAKTFRDYAEWADDQQRDLGFAIKTATRDIERLLAEQGSANSDVQQLARDIAETSSENNDMEAEMAESTALRKKERDIFVAAQTDLAESVEALGKAVDVVTSGALTWKGTRSVEEDNEEAVALLQKMATTVPKMPMVLASFLEEDEVGAPSVAAYQYQSGGVLALLNKLEDKFKKELDQCELEETNRANAYDLELQHLSDTLSASKKDVSNKKAEKGKRAADAAAAAGELQATKEELASDKAMLQEVKTTFTSKQQRFEENQKTRSGEFVAISQAIDIISSPAVSLIHTDRIVRHQALSLLQTQSSTGRIAVRQSVSRFLQQRAALLSSSKLKQIAVQVSASPFAKVTGMISDLIDKLKQEAVDEQDHKKYCDQELKANKLTRAQHATQADKKDAERESLEGTIEELGQTIKDKLAAQSEVTERQKEEARLRADEKASNAETMKDAKAGMDAVGRAIELLTQFYESQTTSLLQLQQVPAMERYSGAQGASKGTIGLLEVIKSDFTRLYAETSVSETSALRESIKFNKDAAIQLASLHKELTSRKLEKDAAQFELSSVRKDLKSAQESLKQARKTQESLKPICLQIHVSWEERSARRKEEIKALQEAYGIMDQKSQD